MPWVPFYLKSNFALVENRRQNFILFNTNKFEGIIIINFKRAPTSLLYGKSCWLLILILWEKKSKPYLQHQLMETLTIYIWALSASIFTYILHKTGIEIRLECEEDLCQAAKLWPMLDVPVTGFESIALYPLFGFRWLILLNVSIWGWFCDGLNIHNIRQKGSMGLILL